MGGNGSGGHNRKSTAQKLVEGNPGGRPLKLREPKALPGEPPMPSGMTEQAKAVWPEVVAMLKSKAKTCRAVATSILHSFMRHC
jgi:hypothetical protein